MESSTEDQHRPPGGPVGSVLMRIPPPLVYVAVFLLGVGIQFLLPVPRAPAGLVGSARAMGAVVLAMGILLGPVNALMFVFRGTTLNPAAAPRRMFTGGVYRVSRNPMYLGLLLVYAGVALLQWQIWALLLISLPFVAVDRVYIPAEEKRMSKAFGEDYIRYCGRVRRWLGTRPPD